MGETDGRGDGWLATWSLRTGAAPVEVPLAVYDELRVIAGRLLLGERSDHTLQPTALVHEAYLRLSELQATAWRDRSHFVGVAASTMRRVLIDHARRRRRAKRSGRLRRVVLDETKLSIAPRDELFALSEALDALRQVNREACTVIELRCFAGLTIEEIARSTGLSTATVTRRQAFARAWLYRRLQRSAPG